MKRRRSAASGGGAGCRRRAPWAGRGRAAAALFAGVATLLAVDGVPGPAALLGPSALSGQELVSGEPGSTFGAGAGPVFQTFRFGDADVVGIESISLLTVPVAARVPLGGRLRTEVRGGWARGTMERSDGSRAEIDGVIDTELRLGADLVPDRVTVTGVVVFPTGVDSHADGELELAGAVASDLLPFRISHWSSGGGGGGSITAVHSFGLTGVGIDIGFLRAGEFHPTAEPAAAYRPGHAFHASAALDRAVNASGKLTFRVDARRYGEDELAGENLFRSGNRVGATGIYSFAYGPASSGLVYAGYRHRAAGTFLVDLERRPSQGAFLAGAGFRTPFGGGVLTPSVDLRVLRRADGTGQGYATSAGAVGEWDLGGVVLLPAARLRLGSVLVQEGSRSGFTGVDLSLQLRGGGGR